MKTESIPLTEKSPSSEIESEENFEQSNDNSPEKEEEEVKFPSELKPISLQPAS